MHGVGLCQLSDPIWDEEGLSWMSGRHGMGEVNSVFLADD